MAKAIDAGLTFRPTEETAADTLEWDRSRTRDAAGRSHARARSGADRRMGLARVTRVTFVHSETVRFRDIDALGHMNNAVYATLVEQARIGFSRRRARTPRT